MIHVLIGDGNILVRHEQPFELCRLAEEFYTDIDNFIIKIDDVECKKQMVGTRTYISHEVTWRYHRFG